MNKNIVIFDLDGTLYPRNNIFFHFLEIKTQKYMMSECPNLTLEEFEEMEKNIPSVIEAINFLGISREKFYRKVYSDIDYNNFFEKDNRLIQCFEKNLSKQENFIVTMSGYKEIENITSILGIDKFITKAYSPEGTNVKSKKELYKSIINEYKKNEQQQVFVIGDGYAIDIVPAIELGIKTIYISADNEKNRTSDFIIKNIYEAFEILQ